MTSKGWFDGVHVSVAAGLSKSVLGLRPGMPSSSQRVQVYRLPEDDLNSVRDCFGHQLAEMIEKLTVRPKDFVYLDRVIKAFGRDGASAQKQRRLTRRLRDHVFSREDLIGFRVRADSGS